MADVNIHSLSFLWRLFRRQLLLGASTLDDEHIFPLLRSPQRVDVPREKRFHVPADRITLTELGVKCAHAE